MVLEIENIGKIERANVVFDGITVIAGDNNTGKSTVGKVLYCLFQAFYNIGDRVIEERIQSVRRELWLFCRENFQLHMYKVGFFDAISETIVQNAETYIEESQQLRSLIETFLSANIKKWDTQGEEKYLELDNLVNRIIELLNVKQSDLELKILQSVFKSEFDMEIGHLNYPDEPSRIHLRVKNQNIDIECQENALVIQDFFEVVKKVVYIDDPFILDKARDYPYARGMGYEVNHTEDLIQLLLRRNEQEDFGKVNEILVDDKLKNIFATMNDVCDGELQLSDKGDLVYHTPKLSADLSMSNVSTGMKSFIIIQKLLKDGVIDNNGILILDEPEIHLHPEWQLKFAQIIVYMQKEFSLNILLNTHSPYFLNALEVYSKRMGIEEKCKYYLTQEHDLRTRFVDVTGNTELIYEKYAKPFQILENEQYR